uniref:Predicted protein n=1 Tax=Hordeum vulgare subsp. vulgare TaxID=112509 RepID=F2EAW7_HORVV|nr:predicted protein [Hordeum vulgare subsp. vulgare]
MDAKRKAESLLVIALVVAAATSPVLVASGHEKATPTCLTEYSKLCGKGEKKNATCTAMVDKACSTEATSVTFIERLFTELAEVGEKKEEVFNLETSGGQDALKESVDKHGGCPGDKTVKDYSTQCGADCDKACMDPTCTDHCYVDCPYMAARFGYIMATPANKKAIEQDMDCFKHCAKEKDSSDNKCRNTCKLISSTPTPAPAKSA